MIDLCETLATTTLFVDFPKKHIKKLAAITSVMEAAAGTEILEEGATGQKLFIIVEGSVDVFKEGGGGQQPIGHLGAGSYFGEMALVTASQKRTATIRSQEPVVLLTLAHDAINALCEQDPKLGMKLYHVIARGLARRLSGTSFDLATLRSVWRPDAGTEVSAPRDTKSKHRDNSAASASKYRVLIVDDDDAVLDVLSMILEEYDVTRVGDGEQAVKALQSAPFDLLLADKNLPGIDGIALARYARSSNPDIRIVIVSGYPSVESAEHLLQLEGDDFVVKPFDVDEVTSKIRRVFDLLQRTQAHRQEDDQQWEPSRNVLLVESDETEHRTLAHVLLRAGFVVASSPDILSGLAQWKEIAGAVVSLDLCDEEAKAELHKRKIEDRHFRFVVVSDQKSFAETVSAMRFGASDRLVRPVNDQASVRERLLRAIRPRRITRR